MTDHSFCSRAETARRRFVLDLSDADLARLTEIEAGRGIDGTVLVLSWVRRGLFGHRTWAEQDPQHGRTVQDVEVARQSDELFGDLLGGSGQSG